MTTMENAPAGRESGEGGEQVGQTSSQSTDAADIRQPCRACKRPNTRPLVPVGSSRWWDLCHRCTVAVLAVAA